MTDRVSLRSRTTAADLVQEADGWVVRFRIPDEFAERLKSLLRELGQAPIHDLGRAPIYAGLEAEFWGQKATITLRMPGAPR